MSNKSMMQISGKFIELGELPFNLHLQDHRGRMILYGRKGITITKEMKDFLIKANKNFYIDSVDLEGYLDYSLSNLEQIVKSKRLKVEKKAEIFRSTGRQIMAGLQSKVVTTKTVEQTKAYTEAMVDFVVSNSKDYSHLLVSPKNNTYNSDHALNCSAFCILLGIEIFGCEDEASLFLLGLGGLLHDIGMAHIDESIINKKEKLTEVEREVIQMHVQLGYNQIANRELPQEVVEMAKHHHERADGTGYPDGLKGDEISVFTMIAGVADVYDALTSVRSFRSNKQHIEALENLLSRKELYFDKVLAALTRIVLRNDELVDRVLAKHGIAAR